MTHTGLGSMLLHPLFENFMEFLRLIVSMLILLFFSVYISRSQLVEKLYGKMIAANIVSASHMTNKLTSYFEWLEF